MDVGPQGEARAKAPDDEARAKAPDEFDEHVHERGPRPPGQRRRRILFGLAAICIAAAVVAFGVLDRTTNVSSLAVTAGDEAVPKVTLILPKPGPSDRVLTLPGDVYAWYQAPIFAQVSGYVRMWFQDYGAVVKKGDLLADIDTPDLDQELEQARAQLEVAQARYALSRVTAQRWQKLAGTQAVSQQEVDVNVADAAAQKAAVDAAHYNLLRYQAQEGFKRIVAPFDGVVTARDTDVGDYVGSAGGSANTHGSATELFTVSDLHAVRIFVSVPQDYASYLKPGLSATLTLPQYAHRRFAATLSTTASAFNTSSRTVLTELTVPNPDHLLWPGAFTEVHFTVPTEKGLLVIPEQSLLFRAQGLQVALVGADHRVHLQDVRLGLNLGATVQVVSGLKDTDELIANPSDGLLEGETVDVVHAPAANTNDNNE